jgi:hypothetical protein
MGAGNYGMSTHWPRVNFFGYAELPDSFIRTKHGSMQVLNKTLRHPTPPDTLYTETDTTIPSSCAARFPASRLSLAPFLAPGRPGVRRRTATYSLGRRPRALRLEVSAGGGGCTTQYRHPDRGRQRSRLSPSTRRKRKAALLLLGRGRPRPASSTPTQQSAAQQHP